MTPLPVEVALVLFVVAAEDAKRGGGTQGRPGQRRTDGWCYRCRVGYIIADGHEHRPAVAPRKTGTRR